MFLFFFAIRLYWITVPSSQAPIPHARKRENGNAFHVVQAKKVKVSKHYANQQLRNYMVKDQ